MNMTREQLHHMVSVVREATKEIEAKYEAGAAEHGGLISDLSEDTLLDNAIDEAVDQLVYLITLRQKRAARNHGL